MTPTTVERAAGQRRRHLPDRHAPSPSARAPSSVAVADVNGDGKPDLVVANYGSNTVSVLLGNGDGTFQAPAHLRRRRPIPLSVAVADVNGDGKPDLVVANSAATTP